MAARDDGAGLGAARVLDGDEVQGVLSGTFYTPGARAGVAGGEQEAKSAPGGAVTRGGEKPSHYKVICISMYTKDLDRLDEMVDELKSKGLTKANRSALIRAALDQVDLDKVPRGI
jgi:hypothetical protein